MIARKVAIERLEHAQDWHTADSLGINYYLLKSLECEGVVEREYRSVDGYQSKCPIIFSIEYWRLRRYRHGGKAL